MDVQKYKIQAMAKDIVRDIVDQVGHDHPSAADDEILRAKKAATKFLGNDSEGSHLPQSH